MRLGLLLAALLGAVSCVPEKAARFPLQDILWEDPDRQPFAGPPEPFVSSAAYDVAHQAVLRPAARAFAANPAGESVNVNAVDEVPSSSWFENRLSVRDLSVEEIVRGPCGDTRGPAPGPWLVTGGKPDGANPGFKIEDSLGRSFLLKFDGLEQPERASSGDFIGSRVYWAAGYTAPCNNVVFFDPARLELDPEGTVKEYGQRVPLEARHIEKALEKANKLADGRVRAGASLFLEGKPLGPWPYQGVIADDPNDVVAHEDRREVRAGYLIAAWLGHVDSREQNTMRSWIETSPGRGWVRHALIDFGDCFGGEWDWDSLNRRLGHASYLDMDLALVDTLTLGAVKRPWDDRGWGPAGRTLGYYDVEHFTADAWRPVYPNPAFNRLTEADAAWMARVLASFPEAALTALVKRASLSKRVVETELLKSLRGRRRKLLRRYLNRLSPLGRARVSERTLCFRDHARHAQLTSASRLQVRAWAGRGELAPMSSPTVKLQGAEVCVRIPEESSMSAERTYIVVELQTLTAKRSLRLRAHLYDLGSRMVLVGLEREPSASPPR